MKGILNIILKKCLFKKKSLYSNCHSDSEDPNLYFSLSVTPFQGTTFLLEGTSGLFSLPHIFL